MKQVAWSAPASLTERRCGMKVEMYSRRKFWDKVRELLGLKQRRVSVIWEVQHKEPGWIGRVRER